MNEQKLVEIEAMANAAKNDLPGLLVFYVIDLIAEVRRLRAVLAEYADHENWKRSEFWVENYEYFDSQWTKPEHGYTRAENALKDG